jgi:PKD domain-containing protein/putative Ig domain-containing protein/parallel beta helix pectate lyase-like protein/Big-like domain-containing protein
MFHTFLSQLHRRAMAFAKAALPNANRQRTRGVRPRLEARAEWLEARTLLSLTPAQVQDLQGLGRSTLALFTDPKANNLLVGFPHSSYGNGPWRTPVGGQFQEQPDLARGYGSHVNMNEVTLRFVALAESHMNLGIGYEDSWGSIQIGLQTIRGFQTSGDPLRYDPSHTFHRAYVTAGFKNGLPDQDLTADEVHRDGNNEQAADDNALAYLNLLNLDGLAKVDPGLSAAERQAIDHLIDSILADINLRRFVVNGAIVHNFVNGVPSTLTWDRVGAEGAPILVALRVSGQISDAEFVALADNLQHSPVNWNSLTQGTIPIANSTYHSAMMMPALWTIHGLPVTGAEVEGLDFFESTTEPILKAHQDYARAEGLEALGSLVMTQTLNGIPAVQLPSGVQVVFAGNEGNVWPEPGVTLAPVTASHALFVALARPDSLDQQGIDAIFSMIEAYEDQFFHPAATGGLGWEVAIPWRPDDTSTAWTAKDGSVRYVDNGRPYEALNSEYIATAIFDATNPGGPLAGYNPLKDQIAQLVAYLADGQTLARDIRVPEHYSSIQAAIDSVRPGELATIWIGPGIYRENIAIRTRGISLIGAGIGQTILKPADGSTSPALIVQGVDQSVTVTGFTITGGYSNSTNRGGGIAIIDASPIIRDNEIASNSSRVLGGGLSVTGRASKPTIIRNLIRNNIAGTGPAAYGGYGGGLYMATGDLGGGILADNQFIENEAWAESGGMFISVSGPTVIAGNLVARNVSDWDAGIVISGATTEVQVLNNVIVNNHGDYLQGSGIKVRASKARIVNNTIVGNTGTFQPGYGIAIDGLSDVMVLNNIIIKNDNYGISSTSPANLGYNLVYGHSQADYSGSATPGPGSISVPPGFVDETHGDYHLGTGSAAIDAGDPDSLYRDADGSRNDMGAYGGPVATWDIPAPPAPGRPVLQTASDTGVSSADGLTDSRQLTFDVPIAESVGTLQLLRDGQVVASRTGPGSLTDNGPLPDGTYAYRTRSIDPSGKVGLTSAAVVATVDTTVPTIHINEVTPDPRDTAVSTITISSPEPIYGLALANLRLTHDGGSNNLLTAEQTLTTSDYETWTLTNLAGLTTTVGRYTLTLTPDGITDAAGNAFTGTLNESWTTVAPINHSPVLDPIGSKTIEEGQTLTFTVVATDPDLPANTLTYSFGPGAPAGITINPVTGTVSWTPTEAQGPGDYPLTVVVTDNGSPALTDSKTITISVREVNTAPVLASIGSKVIDESRTLTFTVSATDADLPLNALTYGLAPGAPAGATIDSATGLFTWTPTEVQGPGSYAATFVVSDNGFPRLGDSKTISITVNEVNTAPALASISDQAIAEGKTLAFTVTATDVDSPAQNLTYRLAPGAPAGAAINPTTGAFTWLANDGPLIAPITIRVTDNGSPPQSVSRTFSVTVSNVPPAVSAGGDASLVRGGIFARNGTFSDPGADAWTAAVDYGDGSGVQPLVLNGKAFVLNHVYTTAGTFTVTVTVQDDDGGVGRQAFSVRVVAPTPIVRSFGTTTSRTGIVGLVLSFSDPMNARRVQNLRNYVLVGAGRDRRFGTKDDRVLKLKKATYSVMARTVTLSPSTRLPKTGIYRLTANGTNPSAGLANSTGTLLDGNRDGVPGGDYVVAFGAGAQIPGAISAQAADVLADRSEWPRMRIAARWRRDDPYSGREL